MRKIALFAHDAGGADILLELLRTSLELAEFRIFCLKESPCFNLIKAKALEPFWCEIIPTKEDIEAKLSAFSPSLIAYGTGWQNHLEYHFLAYANAHGLVSMAFLDHWTNYRERFGYPSTDWEKNLPSFIVAHDTFSERKAKEFGLPNVLTIKNYALLAQLQNYFPLPQSNTLLFLSEPTATVALASFGDAYFWGFTEKEVFEDILACKTLLGCEDILIRLHPSDTPQTYQAIDSIVRFSTASLLEDIACAKIIIGIDTVALYTAYLLGKKVISYIPSTKRECSVPLPHTNQLTSFEHFTLEQLSSTSHNPQNFGMDFALFLKTI